MKVDDRIKNIKVAVHDEEQCIQVQEKLFGLGAKWNIYLSSNSIKNTNARYLFVNDKGEISCVIYNKRYFDRQEYTEIYFKDLMQMEVQEKEDFSKFVGRSGSGDLCIFGEKMLKSIIGIKGDISIEYNNFIRGVYNKTPNYEVVNIQDLKEGDIFCLEKITPNRADIDDFKVFLGQEEDGLYVSNFLQQYEGIGRILSFICANHRVKRFLRD